MKCLLVDRSATMRRILTNALKGIGLSDVTEAARSADAVAQSGQRFDLIIADWGTQEPSGPDLVATLRGNAGTASTPILMVTTGSVNPAILCAAGNGITGYIVKPFTPQALRQKIHEVMANTKAA